jgi:hypothetical protein
METMKKLTATCIALSMATIFLTSCSKDTEKQLEGSWTASSYEGEGTSDDGENSSSSTKDVKISATNAGDYTFNDNGTGSYSLIYQMETTDSNGTKATVQVSKFGEFTWTSGESSVTIVYKNGGKDEFTIETNKRKKQVWKGRSKQTLTSINVGVNLLNDAMTLDLDLNMTLERE